MNFNESECVEKEIEIMQEVLERNVYPDHEDVVEPIADVFDWAAEYGEENHECMEAIWCNNTDRDLIERMGEKINNRGGFQAMQANYYTLLHVFRTLYTNVEDPKVLIAWSRLNFLINVAWHGVGEWRM